MEEKTLIVTQRDFQEWTRGLKKGTVSWHNFYNVIDPTIYNWHTIQKKFNFSTTAKRLPLLFFDIEVDADENTFPDPERAEWTINSLSLFDNTSKTIFLYYIPPRGTSKSTQIWEKEIRELYEKTSLEHKEYHIDNIKFEMKKCRNDRELIKLFFAKVHQLRAIALTGYNSSLFDIPYVVNRARKIFGESYKKVISQFGLVKKFGAQYEIPDITFVDMLVLYKPQSAGGMAFGKAQISYELDYIAKQEIGVGKLEYEGNLISLYKEDPVRFFVYNMFDTVLLYLLNEKLQHIDTLYGLSQFANAPMSKALVGRSLLYQFNKTMNYWDEGKAILCKLYNEEIVAVSD